MVRVLGSMLLSFEGDSSLDTMGGWVARPVVSGGTNTSDGGAPHRSGLNGDISGNLSRVPVSVPRQVAEPGHVAHAAKPAVAADSDMIDDLAAVKHLVQRLGADQVRKIVGLFE